MENTRMIENYINTLSELSSDPDVWITYEEFEDQCGLDIRPAGAQPGDMVWDGYTSLRNREVKAFNRMVEEAGLNKSRFFQLMPKYDVADCEWKLQLMGGDLLNSEVSRRQLGRAKNASAKGAKLTTMLLEKNSHSKESENTLIAVNKVFNVASAFTERTAIALSNGSLKDFAHLPGAAIQQALPGPEKE
jgi:hypothetical protein